MKNSPTSMKELMKISSVSMKTLLDDRDGKTPAGFESYLTVSAVLDTVAHFPIRSFRRCVAMSTSATAVRIPIINVRFNIATYSFRRLVAVAVYGYVA